MPTFIQHCIHFYAILGFPVHQRVRWSEASKRERWTSVFCLAYNLLIGIMVIWSFYFGDAFLHDNYTTESADQDIQSSSSSNFFTRLSFKPLLHMLMKINYYYNYPMSYPIGQTYLLFAGPSLVKQLLSIEGLLQDSSKDDPANVVLTSRPKRTFFFVLLTLNLLFLVGFYSIILQYGDFFLCCPAAAVINILSLYISLAASLLPVGVLLYSLYSSVLLLQAVLHEQSKEAESVDQSMAVRQISHLARVSVALYRLNSLPLILFLLSSGLDTMVTICVLGYEAIYGILAYVLAITAMLLCVSYLGGRVRVLLRSTAHQDDGQFRDSLIEDFLQKKDKVKNEKEPTTSRHQNHRLQLSELEAIYGDQLQVRLFEVLTLDSRTLLQMFLFLLNYSILIMQTK